jgi:hypothetical protein
MKIKETQLDKGGSCGTPLDVTKELKTSDKYASRTWIFTNTSNTEGFIITLQ